MTPPDRAPESTATDDLRVEAVEALSDGVAVVRSGDLGVVLTNRGWRRLFAAEGRLPEVLDVVGSTPDLDELLSEIRRGLDQHQVWRRTLSVRDRAGTIFDCRLSVSPTHHPEHRAVWVIGATDVSTEIDGRRRLQDTVDKLQAEVAELRSRARVRDRHLHVVAHELRTPIAAIAGQVELLQEGGASRTPEQVQEQISVSLADLATLADGLVDDGDEGVRTPVPRRLGLRLELDGVLLRLRSLLRRRQVSVDVPADLEVLADDVLLSEILEHLLLTVVKFSAPGSEMVIEMGESSKAAEGDEAGEAAPRTVRLEIHDRGRGVAASSLDAFVRRGTGDGVMLGSRPGLGGGALQRFVESEQGGYGVTSVVGAGSTFWVELPTP